MEIEKIVSDAFNPLLVVPVVALIFLAGFMQIYKALYWMALGIMMSLIPTVIVIYFTEGRDLKIETRSKRPRAYVTGMASMTFSLIVFHLISAPEIIVSAGVAGLVSAAIFAGANYFSKVSIHTGAMTFSTTLMIKTFPLIAEAGGLIAVLVGWSRIKLDRHTPIQVILGGVLGFICGLLFII